MAPSQKLFYQNVLHGTEVKVRSQEYEIHNIKYINNTHEIPKYKTDKQHGQTK